jgi:hypothetical protein
MSLAVLGKSSLSLKANFKILGIDSPPQVWVTKSFPDLFKRPN